MKKSTQFKPNTINAMKNNQCLCGKATTNLVIIKGYCLFLCEKHTKTLESSLGKKLEPLTRKYYEPKELTFKNYVRI